MMVETEAMRTIRIWLGWGLMAVIVGTGGIVWRLTSHTQVQVHVQVQPPPPQIDDATQRLLDEARQPLDTAGKAKGQILRLQ